MNTNELLFFEPVFKEKVWGGTKLNKQFNYDVSGDNIGECWGISAHKEGAARVRNGHYKGQTLRELWARERALFGPVTSEEFPLLVKIIDASDALSVQVHPNDELAMAMAGYPYGKTECWYILDAEPGAKLIYGHQADSKEELQELVAGGNWDDLFREVPVEAGDFVHVPSGTVHAIGAGIVLLEVQQSSDITYRFYDYDRPGSDGELRPLHIEESIACTRVPDHLSGDSVVKTQHQDSAKAVLVEDPYFHVHQLNPGRAGGELSVTNPSFLLMTVTEGTGFVRTDSDEHTEITKGDHFIVPASIDAIHLGGECTIISAYVPGIENQ
ncbi:type I phosphomannose isomerase catalytic subunit [Salisediminibacterium beveridgei]|uniref:Mannose-6-phosphate isomerase n=1 Tax=Salisediminibacterium beveridgei TaxID=632773 RepID=A0A1D7QS85_9BACI|nr:type I phosphomannose isomerase catalytic subunit [Salisediminibacterium beveridgei]AOM81867.1 Mannose-6-phosphate isomerase [Salisediminibacterium beveridgei]